MNNTKTTNHTHIAFCHNEHCCSYPQTLCCCPDHAPALNGMTTNSARKTTNNKQQREDDWPLNNHHRMQPQQTVCLSFVWLRDHPCTPTHDTTINKQATNTPWWDRDDLIFFAVVSTPAKPNNTGTWDTHETFPDHKHTRETNRAHTEHTVSGSWWIARFRHNTPFGSLRWQHSPRFCPLLQSHASFARNTSW